MIETESTRDRIERARRLLESRLEDDLPLEEVAAAACLSPFHFHRLYRGLTGETVRDCVRRLRLERAAHRLTHTPDDVLTIALGAGYDSHEAFTRAFKRRFDLPPSQWRTERRKIVAAASPSNGDPDVKVRIEKRHNARVAFVRHTGPYNQVGDAWKALMKWGWTKMMFGKSDTFGMCYDDPDVTDADKLRYEACMVVDAKAKPKGAVEVKDIPGGAYAVALHEGPYEQIGRTYAGLCAHVSEHDIAGKRWTLADPPSIEKYLNDPRRTAPEDLRTEVWMPVR